MSTRVDRERLRALLAKAGVRPWKDQGRDPRRYPQDKILAGDNTMVASARGFYRSDEQEDANSALIAEAINALPALLDAIDEAEARVRELEARP